MSWGAGRTQGSPGPRAHQRAFAIRGLMHEAALQADKDPDELSFLHTVRVVRRKLPRFATIPPSAEVYIS
jgi:hypothetical protein